MINFQLCKLLARCKIPQKNDSLEANINDMGRQISSRYIYPESQGLCECYACGNPLRGGSRRGGEGVNRVASHPQFWLFFFHLAALYCIFIFAGIDTVYLT